MTTPTSPWNIPLFASGDTIPSLEALLNSQSTALNTALNSLQLTSYALYATKTAMNAVAGTVVGQHATVNADGTSTNNGDYAWTGSAWAPIGNSAFSIMASPSFGTGYSYGGGTTATVRKIDTRVEVNVQFSKTSAMATGDTVCTFAAGFRPPVTTSMMGYDTSGAGAGAACLLIAATGVVTFQSGPAGTNVWVNCMFETI